MSDVDILYQIANLKEIDYKNTLVLTSIVELLIEKNIITRAEILNKAKNLDTIAISSEDILR